MRSSIAVEKDMKPIWIVDDDESIRWVLEKALARENMALRSFSNAQDAMAALETEKPQVLVSDIRMPGASGIELLQTAKKKYPDLPVIIMTAFSDLDSAVSAFQGGAFEYLAKPFDVSKAVELIRRALEESLHEAAIEQSFSQTQEMLGQAPAMQDVFRAIGRLSQSNVTVMITGESGTGKELVARALHKHSPRSSQPFVALNTAAIPKDLLESELFGHERGAFTGAQAMRRGRFEQAEGGTLFLDEIGDMPLPMQVKVLRALQERRIVRVGGETPIAVDLRLVCATHQMLQERVASGAFREDLYYRINVVELRIPALRERPEDILPLARSLLAEIALASGKAVPSMTAAAEHALTAYPWPGNIRELKNALERASLMSDGHLIAHDILFDRPAPPLNAQQDVASSLRDYLSECERDFILRALGGCQWQIQCCADSLGISRKNLWEKMRKLGIDKGVATP